MKCTVNIDKARDEEVLVFAHKKSALTDAIANLCANSELPITGIREDGDICPIAPTEVCCFIIESGKIYAITLNGKLRIKNRLYELEELFGADFIRINQSCLANMRMIERFSTDFSGTLKVNFKNGYSDYVSRRNLKKVKERFRI